MRTFRVAINGNTYDVDIEEITADSGTNETLAIPAKTAAMQTSSQPAAPAATPTPVRKLKTNGNSNGGMVSAQMPGTIIEIRVKKGDTVTRGEPLVILEAMKMANEVVAPADGTVHQIHVEPKDSVNAGDPLVSLVSQT